MDYKLVYTKIAEKDLQKISPQFVLILLKKVFQYVHSKNPLFHAKKLQGFVQDTYRYRIGDYRVVFRRDTENKKIVILVVLRILHRKDVYKKI